MSNPDKPLHDLLQTWKTEAPGPAFNDEVRRRIRTASAPSSGGVLLWLRLHPAWTGALAASFAIVAGALAGLVTQPAPDPRADADALFRGTTLAASYLSLAAGGSHE